jgi:rhodanese-related sulfurtransferase
MMIIDLRTAPEKARAPRRSDVEIEMPVPPWTRSMREWLADSLLDVARHAPPGEVFHVFCAKGKRSALAAEILRSFGYKVEDWGGTA